MSDGMNKVFLLGHIGAEPELRFTQGGQAVLNVRLATNESYLDKDKVRKEKTEWHTVIVWGARGEGLAKVLKKGDMILIEGGLRTSSFEKDGVKRYKTEIHATNVCFAGGGKRGGDDTESGGGYTRAPARARNPDAEGPGPAADDFNPDDY